MKLNFKYSLENEKKVIKSFYDLKDWMIEHGYKGTFYPKKADPFKISLKKMFEYLEEEYDENDYKKVAEKAGKYFDKIKDSFFKFSESVFGKKVYIDFDVYLTKYGFGGNYTLPNIVNVQFTMFKGEDIALIIMHEITHLFIEEDIQKYGIIQHEKERIVYLIQEKSKLIPDGPKYPTFGGVEVYIDDLFHDLFFKDRKKFFKQIKTRREVAERKP